eukprot:1531906-Pyramimonas_sp.AAC.1
MDSRTGHQPRGGPQARGAFKDLTNLENVHRKPVDYRKPGQPAREAKGIQTHHGEPRKDTSSNAP